MALTVHGLRVLRLFLTAPQKRWSGAQIGRELKLGSGTLYPLLSRFEKAGWLESDWEQVDPSKVGRPRRRLYRVTALGQNSANAEIRALGFDDKGELGWAL